MNRLAIKTEMTEKKLIKSLNRIWFHWSNLQKALNDAHNDEIIQYETYADEAPCHSLYELKDRIEATTKEQISTIIHKSIRSKVWK